MQCVRFKGGREGPVRAQLASLGAPSPEFIVTALGLVGAGENGKVSTEFVDNSIYTTIRWIEKRKDKRVGRYVDLELCDDPISGRSVEIADCGVRRSKKRQGFGRSVVQAAALIADAFDANILIVPEDDGEIVWPHLGAVLYPRLGSFYEWPREKVRDIAAATRALHPDLRL